MSDPEVTVLFANDAFYVAFVGGDLAAMGDLWATDTPVSCIHPGSPVIVGRTAVLDSWQPILASGQTRGFVTQNATATVIGELAWVTCFECLDEGALAATNIFVLEHGRWKMCHHHAGATRNGAPRSMGPGPGSAHLH